MKKYLIGFEMLLVIVFINTTVGAQQLKEDINSNAPKTEQDIDDEIDKILKGLSVSDIKKGVNDEGINYKSVIKEVVKETAVKLAANAALVAPAAVKIYSKYKKKESKKLGTEIAGTRKDYTNLANDLEKVELDIIREKTKRKLYNSTTVKNGFGEKFGVNQVESDLKDMKKYNNTLMGKSSEIEKKINTNTNNMMQETQGANDKMAIAKKTGNAVHVTTYERLRIVNSIDEEIENKKKVAAQSKAYISASKTNRLKKENTKKLNKFSGL